MGDHFEWDFDESEEEERPPRPLASPRRARSLAVIAALVIAAGCLLWYVARAQLAQAQAAAQVEITHALSLLETACRNGDGELFFSLQQDHAGWRAALLRPERFEPYCAGQQVVAVEPAGRGYAATVRAGDGPQRQLFFQASAGEARQIAPPQAYWGSRHVRQRPDWGNLVYSLVDVPFIDDIAAFIDEQVAAICAAQPCRPETLPFSVELRPDYGQTAAPDQVYIPSPRLLGLDAAGRPAPEFWEALAAALEAHLAPGVIRFAVPPRLEQAINYEEAAAEFMRRNPHIRVEIVELDLLPEETGASLAEFDGAAYAPTAAMISAGLVVDLTDLAASDAGFRAADFHRQMQQGARWRGRLWFMPLAGQMRLLFYDRNAYEAAGLEAPRVWTWERLAADMDALAAVLAPLESWSGEWLYLDATRDSLFARATSREGCAIPCDEPPVAEDAAAAIEWYLQLVAAGQAPDTAAAPPADRQRLMANWQGVPRRAALWLDDPVNYEHYLQMWPVGVSPLAESSPLWLHGGFISSRSERPRDVWSWLLFLSGRPTNRSLRYVPARSSVASGTGYWQMLPGPLRQALEIGFPASRPVAADERELFSRAELDAALLLGPGEAVAPPPELSWFGR